MDAVNNDLFTAAGLNVAPATHKNDKARADLIRVQSLARQRKTFLIMEPFFDASNRLRRLALQNSDVTFQASGVDVGAVTIAFLDLLSERMLQSATLTVSDDLLLTETVLAIRNMSPETTDDQGRYFYRKMVDALSNSDGSRKKFEVSYFCAQSGATKTGHVKYLDYEGGDDGGWRLTEDGMLLTLRLFNVDHSIADINSELISRALERGKIDEVKYQVGEFKRTCNQHAALLRTKLRDAERGILVDWSEIEDTVNVAFEAIGKHIKSVALLSDKLRHQAAEAHLQPAHRRELSEVTRDLDDVRAVFSSLHSLVMSSYNKYHGATARGLGKSFRIGLMPDLYREVVLPMMALPSKTADSYLREAVVPFFPLERLAGSNGAIDLDLIFDEMRRERDREETPFDEEFSDAATALTDDTLDLAQILHIEKMVEEAFRQKSPASLSEVLPELVGHPDYDGRMRAAFVIEALTFSREGFDASPSGKEFELPGMVRGDDVIISVSGSEDGNV